MFPGLGRAGTEATIFDLTVVQLNLGGQDWFASERQYTHTATTAVSYIDGNNNSQWPYSSLQQRTSERLLQRGKH